MLTFEKVLKVFKAYLDDDPLYEVIFWKIRLPEMTVT